MFSAQPTDSLFPCSRPLTGVLDLHSYCRAEPCRTSSRRPRFRLSQGGRTSSVTIIDGRNHRTTALNEVLLINWLAIRTTTRCVIKGTNAKDCAKDSARDKCDGGRPRHPPN